jgi:hypothetical protein
MSDMHSVSLRGFDDVPVKKKRGRPAKGSEISGDKNPLEIPVEPAPEPDFPSSIVSIDFTPPPVRTEALITEETIKAIRSINIAPHLRIRRINVEPEHSISDDAHLLSAEVTVKFSLIFPREDA